MDLNDLHEIAQSEAARRRPVQVRICTAAGCLSSGADAVRQGLDSAVTEAGSARSRRGLRSGLYASLLRRAVGPGRSRRAALRAGRRRARPRRSSGRWTAARPKAPRADLRALSSPGRVPSCWRTAVSSSPSGSSRTSRPAAISPCTSRARDDARGGHRRSHPERPARPRRRGLSDRAEMGNGRQEPPGPQVRRLQRR